jgi:hypothetical protein
MDSTEVIAIFGPIMPLIVGVFKKLLPKVDPRHIAIGYSLMIAVGTGVATLSVGQEAFQDLLATVGAISGFIFAIGTGLYHLQR